MEIKTGPNDKEKKIWAYFRRRKTGATIRECARAVFPGVRPIAKADSWVRNSLRFWVSVEKKLKRVGEGKYAPRTPNRKA